MAEPGAPHHYNGSRWERLILAVLSGVVSLLLIVLSTAWINLRSELHALDERQRDGLSRLRAAETEIQHLAREVQRLTR